MRTSGNFHSTIQWRTRVYSVLTQSCPKSRNFSIRTFGGINQACSYGDALVWMKKFFNIGSFFVNLGLSGLRQKDQLQFWSNRLAFKKNTDWHHAARSQLSGYGGLVVGIDKKLSKSSAVVWHFSTIIIPIQKNIRFYEPNYLSS